VEVWEVSAKVHHHLVFISSCFIDHLVRYSSKKFVNGGRISPEGLGSEPYELRSDNIAVYVLPFHSAQTFSLTTQLEFSIDIAGEDNQTIIHPNVSVHVACVFSKIPLHRPTPTC
jgi:hypothetical protein